MAALATSTPVIIMLVLFAFILVIYMLGSWFSKGTVVISTPVKKMGLTEADLVYSLPSAAIQLEATATVVVVKDADTNLIISANLITSASLIEISFENTVSIVPDPNAVFALNYISSGYMADEVKFSIDSSGLLENIATTTEDRLSSIITTVSEAPSEILDLKFPIVYAADIKKVSQNKATETLQFTKKFNILSSEIEAGKTQREWYININGNVGNNVLRVDASFDIMIENNPNEKFKVKHETTAISGILTRPLHTVKMVVTLKNPPVESISKIAYELKLPDSSCLINVLIKRSPFVKRVNTPKFSSGLLIENYISKPSEFEGLVSIPVNIGKAIASIPAQLFTFTIKNKARGQIAEMEMQKQILQLKKDIIEAEANMEKIKKFNNRNTY
ncbi:MAG: hypothetical protein JWQ06_150 [Mucilaginibacter sp.]|nr:hypothetical protein [Mucilaginibacter sp.]